MAPTTSRLCELLKLTSLPSPFSVVKTKLPVDSSKLREDAPERPKTGWFGLKVDRDHPLWMDVEDAIDGSLE